MERYKEYSPRIRETLKRNEPNYGFHRKKLMRGVLYCVIAYFEFYSSYSQYLGSESFKSDVSLFLQRFIPSAEITAFFAGLIYYVMVFAAIWGFIAGPYNIFTFQEYYSTYDAPYPILHQLRDLFIRLGNSTYTDFLPNGGDSNYEGEHKHIQRLVDYVDGKIGGKDSEQGLDFLRGKKK